MEIKSRRLVMWGDHTVPNPWFSRVVVLNDKHTIELREYANGVEECLVNGTVYARDSLADIKADTGTAKAPEAFEELTGLYRQDWDRSYRRMYWSGWMDSRKTWWLDFTVDHAQFRKLAGKYWEKQL